jgi:hypothetical protein
MGMLSSVRSVVTCGLIVGVAVAILATGGASSAGYAEESPSSSFHHKVTIHITDDGLEPATVTGTLKVFEIVWVNESSLPRRVSEPTFGLFDSGRLMPGDSYEYSPEAAGGFDYVSDVDPSLDVETFQASGRLRIAPVPGPTKVRGERIGRIVRWKVGRSEAQRLETVRGRSALFDVKWGRSPDVASSGPANGWRWWHRGTHRSSGWRTVACGWSYFAKVRLRDPSSNATSRWSPATEPLWVCVSHGPI